MRALLLAALSLGSCAPVAAPSPVSIHDFPCMPGEVVLFHTSPAPCDVVGGQNTLTILGLPDEGTCQDWGGVWVYEACKDVDF